MLNYPIESLRELIRKGEDGSYALSEFGLAGLNLIKRIEDPVSIQTDRNRRSRSLLLQTLGVSLIIGLAVGTGHFTRIIRFSGQRQVISIDKSTPCNLTFRLIQGSLTLTSPHRYQRSRRWLWRYQVMDGTRRASEEWRWKPLLRMRDSSFSDTGGSGFMRIRSVTEPVGDDATEPGAYPPVKGTIWYRYVWTVIVHESDIGRSIPPPGLYWMDASTEGLFKFNGLGVVTVKSP